MKDIDNIYGEPENKNSLEEVTKNDEAFENREEGKKENEEELSVQGKNNEEEKENAWSEGKNTEDEEKDNKEQAESIGSVKAQYSSYYCPPYYEPTFSASTAPNTDVKKKRKRGLIIFSVSAVLILAFLCFSFSMWSELFSSLLRNEKPQLNLKNESVSVVQNSPKMAITKNTDSSYIPQSLPEVVSKVGNSVVEIKTSRSQSSFYGQYVTSGAGSGVIVTQSDEAGYLLTNHHVVYSDLSSSTPMNYITVVLTSGEEYSASILGSDPSIDLAVLRIEKKANEQFTVAEFGDSGNLVVGQDIIAIGNPLGSLGGTVTDGIISALDRRVKIDGITMVLLQHNAAINPGNSGGALFDMMGNLVGIVNAKSSESGIEGLGFAIPSNIAFNFLNRVMVIEPAIGIQVQYGRLDGTKGLYVVSSTNSEFKRYDRITAVNGEQIDSAAQYYAIIDCANIGDTVTITVVRDGSTRDIRITIKK